jgi:hypothetical protein
MRLLFHPLLQGLMLSWLFTHSKRSRLVLKTVVGDTRDYRF